MKNRYTFLLFLAFIAVPFLAEACPMCQGGTTGGTVQAYRGTTIFLVLLPFISGWLIYRFVKKEME
jgi:hypothetical protein